MESKIDCCVCYQEYDDDDHTPCILPICGHTLCKTCAMTIITINDWHIPNPMPNDLEAYINPDYRSIDSNDKIYTLKATCPYCKTEYEEDVDSLGSPFDITCHLPKNYALLDVKAKVRSVAKEIKECHTIMASYSVHIETLQNEHKQEVEDLKQSIDKVNGAIPNCALHGLPCSMICLNADCASRHLCCVRCLRTIHLQCSDELILDRHTLSTRVKKVSYDVKYDQLVKDLTVIKTQVIDQISKKFEGIMAEFEQTIKTNFLAFEVDQIESVVKVLDYLNVSSENLEGVTRFEASPLNKSQVDFYLTKGLLEKYFEENIIEGFERLVNSTLKNLISRTSNIKHSTAELETNSLEWFFESGKC